MSLALDTALGLARAEARAAGKLQVDAAQLFCGATKLIELWALDHLNLKSLPSSERAGFDEEVRQLQYGFAVVAQNTTQLRRLVRRAVGSQSVSNEAPMPHRSDHLRAIFDQAGRLAASEQQPDGPRLNHALRILCEHRELKLVRVLEAEGVDLDQFCRALSAPVPNEVVAEAAPIPNVPSSTPTLQRFGRDLTALAAQGKLGPVIGRRDLVLRMLQVLVRRSKNNVMLVGEAGVGKTAVAELLAIRLQQNRDSGLLQQQRLIEISMSSLLAGASRPGQREERLKLILEECQQNPEIILFIDEIHTLMAAGGVGGAIDPADMLKPALARGELRCIGATTADEYRRFVEQDSALERRFDVVMVDEPTPEETLAILQGVRGSLESHHQLHFPDTLLERAIELTVRFDPDHQLPDKAIDLLDTAAARSRMPALSLVAGVTPEPQELTERVLVQTLAERQGIPEELVNAGTAEHAFDLDKLARELRARVVGQDPAIDVVCRRLQLSYAPLLERRGPLGVLLFTGPSGVGKTELAKGINEAVFGSHRDCIRLDMSEYMEEHSVAKLIGAPPGYVGYQDAGRLTDALRKQPHALVLLDEIEKAHPRVFDLFLQVFDEGHLTDAKGRTTDCRHALFVLTSNVKAAPIRQAGFNVQSNDTGAGEADRAALNAVLLERFRPEFLNRIDEIVAFRALDGSDIRTLVDRHLIHLAQTLSQQHDLKLQVPASVREWLASQGYAPQNGARELNRCLEVLLQQPLAAFLAGQPQSAGSLVVALAPKGLDFQLQKFTD